MFTLILVNILAPILSFIGIILISHKNKLGFLVFFFVEFCMFYIGFESKQWGVLAMSIIYFFANIYGYCQWVKDDLRIKNLNKLEKEITRLRLQRDGIIKTLREFC